MIPSLPLMLVSMAIIPCWKTEQQILQLFPAVLVLVTAQHSEPIKDTKGDVYKGNIKSKDMRNWLGMLTFKLCNSSNGEAKVPEQQGVSF